MKTCFSIVLLFLFTGFVAHAMEEKAGEKESLDKTSAIKWLVIEIDDVLTEADEVQAYSDYFSDYIGKTAAYYVATSLDWIDSWTGGNLKEYTHQQSTMIMEALCQNHLYDDLKGDTNVLYRKRPLPALWCARYLDKITGEEAVESAKETIAEHTQEGSYLRQYANLAAEIGFDPEREVKYLKPIEKGFALARDCAANPNNRVLIWSNKSIHTMKALVAVYPEFFGLFKDRIITSGEAGMLKPNPKFYEKIIEDYGIDIKNCYFVDSQAEYLEPAAKLGARIIEINHNNFENDFDEAREYFIDEGIIIPQA